MSIAALNYVGGLLLDSGIPYNFMYWQEKPPDDYYFVGEYIEMPSATREESGRQDSTFILRGFTRKSWLYLEQAKEKIEKHCVRTAILSDGTGIAVSYNSAVVVPTGDNELKSIKINLDVREWKVNG